MDRSIENIGPRETKCPPMGPCVYFVISGTNVRGRVMVDLHVTRDITERIYYSDVSATFHIMTDHPAMLKRWVHRRLCQYKLRGALYLITWAQLQRVLDEFSTPVQWHGDEGGALFTRQSRLQPVRQYMSGCTPISNHGELNLTERPRRYVHRLLTYSRERGVSTYTSTIASAVDHGDAGSTANHDATAAGLSCSLQECNDLLIASYIYRAIKWIGDAAVTHTEGCAAHIYAYRLESYMRTHRYDRRLPYDVVLAIQFWRLGQLAR